MNRSTYDNLMLKYIKDTQCITAHPSAIEKLQARIKKFAITPLAKELGLTKIVVHSPSTPRLFGFAKTHKTDKALRPVVDKGCASTILLERLVNGFVNKYLPQSPYSIKQPLDLLQKMANMNPQEIKYMTVLDFKTLYPSVKLEPCFCHLRDFLLTVIKSPEKKRKQILEMAHLTTFSSIFSFNGITYTQQKGVAMGSPLAGTLCEMVLRTLENALLPKYATQILTYARYVDDVVVFWNVKPNLHQFITDINDNKFGLEIELEQENDKHIHFLDLSIQLDSQGAFRTKVYRKPTYNPIFIPWNSHDPPAYKLAAFRAVAARAHTHCSSTQDKNEEMNYIIKLAQNKLFYIGATRRSLKERLAEHQRNIRSEQPCTALATYVLADPQKVQAEWAQARLVQAVRNIKHLRYTEAWHIGKASQKGQSINFREASKISAAWRSGDM
ncbi:uncharacterized protein [Centruroides vittatus]|uniref:uncharacterized protein n=1 Tax=Centruroides vittatus TaxID=120091 RepID=UPI00350FCF3A